jgi:RHS repeat-associated protein
VVAAAGLDQAQGFVYDHDSNRVALASGGDSVSYAYDRSGQLLSLDDDAHDPELFAYDAWGNLTNSATDFDAVTTYAYDAADRLVSITQPNSTQTAFTLDALGRHASFTTDGVTTEVAYLGTSETAWQLAPTGSSTVNSAVDADGSRLAIDAGGSADGFVLADLHGNPAATVNAADDAILSATRYDAYGQRVATYDSGGAFPTDWGFQGRLDISPDPATPLYEFSARFYAPLLGTFTQLDTYPGDPASPLSLNRYLYAAANPWTLIDPTGHRFEMGPGGDGGSGCVGECKAVPLTPPRIIPPPAGPPAPLPEAPRTPRVSTPTSVRFTPDPAPSPAALPRQLTACPDVNGCKVPDAVLFGLGAVFVVSGGVVIGIAAGPTVAQGTAYAGGGGAWGLCVWACDKVNRVATPFLEGLAGAPQNSISTTYASSRVSELQELVPLASRGRVTMGVAVAENSSGLRMVLVGTSEPRGYLRPGVRQALQTFETVVPSPTRHAEQNIITYAQSHDLTLLSIEAGRPPCSDCARLIQQTLQ